MEKRNSSQRKTPKHDKRRPDSLEREPALSLEERIDRLVAAMRDHIKSKQPINLSIPPHREITEALHQLVYEKGEKAKLKIKYNDNSSGESFPLHILTLPDPNLIWRPEQALNIGTLTFRHLEYDNKVDLYLIRDRETRNLNNAETEMLAYDRMNEILLDPILKCESYLAIYQTGLEPLIVGLYRALAEHLKYRSMEGIEQMCVLPVFFFDGECSETGTLWG